MTFLSSPHFAHVILVKEREDSSHELRPTLVGVEASHLTGGRYPAPRGQLLHLHVRVEVGDGVVKVKDEQWTNAHIVALFYLQAQIIY